MGFPPSVVRQQRLQVWLLAANMSWAEKLLMEHPEHPELVIPFPQLDKALVADILRRAAE